MSEKWELRQEIKKRLRALTDEEYERLSEKIARRLRSSSLWIHSNVIAVTISRGREVDTKRVIEAAWHEKKTIAVPRTNFKEKTMTFYAITSFNDVEKTERGLFEPKLDKAAPIEIKAFDLIIVPGLAFTKEGLRLGYGGGFYDRFLVKTNAPTVSLAFPCQIVAHVPTERHDRPIDYLVTPDGFYRCSPLSF